MIALMNPMSPSLHRQYRGRQIYSARHHGIILTLRLLREKAMALRKEILQESLVLGTLTAPRTLDPAISLDTGIGMTMTTGLNITTKLLLVLLLEKERERGAGVIGGIISR
jgi:hypothetical protein